MTRSPRPSTAERRPGRTLAPLGLALAALFADPARAAELVMFDARGCEWCAAWEREVGTVYPKTAEGRLAPLRRVDLHGARPRDLQFITGVVYTPTFVLVEDGAELGRIAGYPGEGHFWGLLGEALKNLKGRKTATTAE